MAQWKNKEEYEKWKVERARELKEKKTGNQEPPQKETPTITAEKKCRYCAMMIPREAYLCPHCRKRVRTSPATKVALAIIIILVLLGLIGSLFTGGNHGSLSKTVTVQQHDEKEAFYISQQIVEKILKAPSTAKFPWFSESEVRGLSDGSYHVKSYVDSQNSFGAMLRSNYLWIGHFDVQSNGWKTEYFKLGDEEIINNLK